MIKNSQKGFSLIELSIVLIIVGLLIAGIIGGAALVNIAELRAIITESNNYKTGIGAYYAKSDRLPGDDNNPAHSYPGNANARIEYYNDSGTSEAANAWHDMYYEGILFNDYNKHAGNAVTVDKLVLGEDIPSSKISGAGWILDYLDEDEDPASAADTIYLATDRNELIFTAAIPEKTGLTVGTVQQVLPVAIIAPDDARIVDIKMDDGNPSTGSVRALGRYLQADDDTACKTGDGATEYENKTNDDYEVNYSAEAKGLKTCSMSFELSL